MADEARAMLDALMGADRNASQQQQPSEHERGGGPKRKRSCYDPAVCPLYCAWGGTDLHELFRNTKSDLGPNPRVCDDDALEEYASLPDHERDRLGYERFLYDRLRDLIGGCDRTVKRNKTKLRTEIARQQRVAGGRGDGDDPAANISEERLLATAEGMARIELLGEELVELVAELDGIDEEEEGRKADRIDVEADVKGEGTGGDDEDTLEDKEENEEKNEEKNEDKEKSENMGEDKEDPAAAAAAEEDEGDGDGKDEGATGVETEAGEGEKRPRSEVLARILSVMNEVQSLKETVSSNRRHLDNFRSTITIDKTVCEVSGNFMSYRDADERIAAHYAGKQYVGWKMVRDKYEELKKKHLGGRGRGASPPYHRDGGRGAYEGGGSGGGYGGRYGGSRHGDRGRGRDRDRDRGYDRDRDRRGRRSPDRWERDRHDWGGGDVRRGRW